MLDSHPDRAVVLVRGPAGAGKTTLVTQWVRAHGQPCAWLSADATHDAARLLGDLIAMVGSLHPDTLHVATARPAGGNGLDVAAQWDVFAAATQHVVSGATLVLDDIHRLHDPTVRHVLGKLVEHPLEGIRLVLVSRSKPRLGLERARLRGDLVEVTPADLRFRREEVDDLVSGWTGRRPDAADIEQRTLGWAAGLRLAQLETSGREAASPGLAVSDTVVSEYVAEELVEGFGPGARSFLEVTCWLPFLTEALCQAVDAVVDGHGGWRFDLEALPIVPTASRPGWFRYPPILVPALQEQCWRRDPRAATRARRHAAHAARQAGQLMTSLRLFLQAGLVDEGADVCRALATEGESALRSVDELLRELPEPAPVGTQWRAWRARAAVAAGRIGEARHLLEGPDPGDGATASPGEGGGEDLLIARAMVAEHVGDVTGLLTCADRLLVAGEGAGPSGDVARLAHGWRIRALVWSGDADSARSALRALDQLADQAPPTSRIDVALARAWVAWVDGDVSRLAEITAAARVEIDDRGGSAAELALLSGAAHRERNHMAQAVTALEEACANATESSEVVVAALAGSELARCHRAAGASMDALELVTARRAQHPGLPPVVDTHLRSTEARVRLDQGDLGGAQAAVRDAPGGVDTSLLAARLALHGAAPDVRELLDGVETRTPRQAVEKLLLYAQLPEAEPGTVSAALVDAIAAGRPLGLIRTFLDEGPAMNRRLVDLGFEVNDRDVGRLAALACQELAQAPARPPAAPVERLTARELAVLRMLPLRMSNREMAAQIYVSINTLKTHIRAIYRKLDVPHRSEAVRRAKALQLV